MWKADRLSPSSDCREHLNMNEEWEACFRTVDVDCDAVM